MNDPKINPITPGHPEPKPGPKEPDIPRKVPVEPEVPQEPPQEVPQEPPQEVPVRKPEEFPIKEPASRSYNFNSKEFNRARIF